MHYSAMSLEGQHVSSPEKAVISGVDVCNFRTNYVLEISIVNQLHNSQTSETISAKFSRTFCYISPLLSDSGKLYLQITA